MRPYNVEIFTQDFEMVGNTNVNVVLPYGIRAGAVHRHLAWAVPSAVAVDHQRVLRHVRIGGRQGCLCELPGILPVRPGSSADPCV